METTFSFLWKLTYPLRFIIAFTARSILFFINNGLRILGPILVLLTFTLIASFALEVVYMHSRTGFYNNPAVALLKCFTDIYVGLGMTASYVNLIRIGPGICSHLDKLPSIPPLSRQCLNLCRKCVPQRLKFPRDHHCGTCNTCIRRMDHHCPWINQCVGEGNYNLFLLFLAWAIAGSVYVVASLIVPFCYQLEIYNLSENEDYALTLVFLLAASFSAVLTGFLGLHIFLIYKDRSTLEFELQITPPSGELTILESFQLVKAWDWKNILIPFFYCAQDLNKKIDDLRSKAVYIDEPRAHTAELADSFGDSILEGRAPLVIADERL